MKTIKSNVLKLALFATGFSGIVAEYNLSTLASYFIGDSVFQWTMIVSVMLFSMGLGSRFSKNIKHKLLLKFIYIEYLLSFLIAFSSLSVFVLYSYSVHSGIIIYIFSIVIGILIGMEIPIVIRINKNFESLRINVSSVIEKDYYGSLLGGIFFAFVGLPFFGIIYTPFILGIVNFSVAILLLIILWKEIHKKIRTSLISLSVFIFIILIFGIFVTKPITLHGEQKRYKDKIILSEQSKYQKIVITEWRNEHWLYINNKQQLCTIDEAMYHEPLVHPAAKLSGVIKNVLILGGGDGCALREVLKYKDTKKIVLTDLDPLITDLAKNNKIIKKLNNNSLNNKKVRIVNRDAFKFVEDDSLFYDLIIIDLPDPSSIELNKLYTQEFYMLCKHRLCKTGTIVTQAGSPYFAGRAFECIEKTMKASGFSTLAIHNNVVTMGEWGWIIGKQEISQNELKNRFINIKFDNIETKWINEEALLSLSSFGKNFFNSDTAEVNKIHNPVLYKYYTKGNWDLY